MSETRYKGASCALTGIPLAHLRQSKLAAGNLPDSGAICNPSPRFNGGRFRSTEPNAYILRNTLSGCVFLGSRTFEYAPRRKALSFASCLYLRVLTVDVFARQSETRIYCAILCRACVFAPFPAFPYGKGRWYPTPCLPFLTKGRCRAERDDIGVSLSFPLFKTLGFY